MNAKWIAAGGAVAAVAIVCAMVLSARSSAQTAKDQAALLASLQQTVMECNLFAEPWRAGNHAPAIARFGKYAEETVRHCEFMNNVLQSSLKN